MSFYSALRDDFAGRMIAKQMSVAGLMIMARDTRRVLLIQRALDPDDPAGGMWELPGGHLENGESPVEGAIREWREEVGVPLPDGEFVGSWVSLGTYQGFIYLIPHESDLQINLHPDDRPVINPDQDHDHAEVVAWWDSKSLKANPALRKEFKKGTDWQLIGRIRTRAI